MALVLTGCKSEEKKPVAEAESQPKPNIVFIYMDDLGYGDMSAYGATEISTPPNMDALAEGGIKFTKGYATSATCTPSVMLFLQEGILGAMKMPKYYRVRRH